MTKTTNHPAEERLNVAETETPQVDETPSATTDVADPSVEIAALKAKIASLEDGVLRAKADFQNLQRRSANERAEAIRYANADLIRSLLNVVDDLDRTLAAAEQNHDATALLSGVKLARDSFLKTLRDNGLEPIDAMNKRFDPESHNALMRQPSAEHPAGTVIQEVARGYRLRERVIRPSMVIVACEPKSDESGQDESDTKDA